jgi:DNA-binding NtrC family response regulator
MAVSRFPAVRKLVAWFEQVREPVFALDARHRMIFVNRAWEELTGLSASDVLGRVCQPPGSSRGDDGTPGPLLDSFAPPPEALVDRPAGGPALIVRPDGSRSWHRLDFWPLRGRDSDGVAVLLGFVRERDATPWALDSPVHLLRAELEEVRARLRARHVSAEALLGVGPAHRRLLDQVKVAAASEAPVLILGEPGTGRRTVARAIHSQGPSPSSALVPIDCAAMPAEFLESQLFPRSDDDGRDRREVPDAGTLVLLDAWDLPRDLQVRLAESPPRLGRLIAVSSQGPDEARRADRLHPSLYFQMTTLVVALVPLRDRLDDLPILAQHFLERVNDRSEERRAGFAPEALEALLAYDWPGNLRELSRVVEAAHAHAAEEMIQVGDLPASIRGNLGAPYPPPAMPSPIMPLDPTLTRLERQLIEKALAHARQNKSRAAELLDISRPRLYRRMKELNIPDVPEPVAAPVAASL